MKKLKNKEKIQKINEASSYYILEYIFRYNVRSLIFNMGKPNYYLEFDPTLE